MLYWITLGKTVGGVLVVVHSYREIHDNETLIRIISARTATNHEQQQYEAQYRKRAHPTRLKIDSIQFLYS